MRTFVATVAFGVTLCLGAPVAAPQQDQAPQATQQQPLTQEERDLVEHSIGPLIDAALDMCVTSDALDVAALEARASAAGWPTFQDMGQAPHPWRASTYPPGDRVLVSFGMNSEAVEGAPAPTRALSCMFVTPGSLGDVVRSHVATRFGGQSDGFYFLQNGALRPLTLQEMLVDFPAILGQTPPGARLVAVHTEPKRDALIGAVTVFYPDSSP